MSRYHQSFSRKKQSFQPKRRFFRAKGQPPKFDPSFLIQKQSFNPEKGFENIQHSFDDFKINQQIKNNLRQKGYQTPTPIQDKTIPLIIDQKDVVGIANTGTGKTAAFLIPLINKVYNNQHQKVLIITPTRELAAQIQKECTDLAQNLNIYSALCIGGVSIKNQIQNIRQSPSFIIGTPGRLIDLQKRHILKLQQFTTIVLDEVDRMLDMGFIHDIKYLISNSPQNRQSLFFSATIEGKTNQVMKTFLKNPHIISVKKQNITNNVYQKVIKLAGRKKIDVLHQLLSQEGFNKVLVFGRTKWSMEKLSKTLINKGLKATAIHGNKSQNQRQRALTQFKTGQVRVLLATDIAQRGLDINQVTHVINYDLPETREDYIHRIGRTGRLNQKGIAITFIN